MYTFRRLTETQRNTNNLNIALPMKSCDHVELRYSLAMNASGIQLVHTVSSSCQMASSMSKIKQTTYRNQACQLLARIRVEVEHCPVNSIR